MKYSVAEVLQYVKENDVKFVRLAYCDIFGIKKNISIMADRLKTAFETGIAIDVCMTAGFENKNSCELVLVPDPSTLCVLPWRPSHGSVVRLFCNVYYPDLRPFECDGRKILQDALLSLAKYKFDAKFGTESEFYLFKLLEEGEPEKIPHDNAGYMDIAPLDKGENVRREICLTLEEMGISPAMSYHEAGPGQHEIVFEMAPPVTAAENFLTFKRIVKTVAAGNGLHATFMAKPIAEKAGNGMHINLMLTFKGINIFEESAFKNSPEAQSFVAGILKHAKEICLFLNPLTNSYKRIGEHSAPKAISWSYKDKNCFLRVAPSKRLEIMSVDGACNPYAAFAAILYAGTDGIENNMTLDSCEKEDVLPQFVDEAINCLKNSAFIKKYMPSEFLDRFIKLKEEEYIQYKNSADKQQFETEKYFYSV